MSRERRRWELSLCCWVLLLASVSAQATVDDVYVLTNSNFKSFLESKPATLVHYYAPWCSKCKSLEPKFAEVAAMAKKNKWPLALAKVDAKAEEDAAKDVYGYPTIKLFKKGGNKEGEDYEGGRDAAALTAYVERVVAAETLPLVESPEQLAKMAAETKQPLVLGLFRTPVHASAAFKALKQAAFEFHGQGVSFAYSAAAAGPPVAPLTGEGKKPAVPGLVLMDKAGAKATAALPVPRKKELFNLEYVQAWLGDNGMTVTVPEKPTYPEKEYSDPNDTGVPNDDDDDEPYGDD